MWSPRKARLASPIKRRSQNTQLPANCCGRKAQLDGKFSALCGFGIKPGYRSCERDLGVLGNHPAVQNMLLAARAFSSRRKPRPLSACRPACTHMPCYRSATPWDGLGQYAASRSPMSSARIGGGAALQGSVATANRACAVLIDAFRSREEFTRRVLVNPDLISRISLLCSR